MASKISFWLKGRPEQPLDAFCTDFINLGDSMSLDPTHADTEEMYMQKYWRLRKQVDEDEACNNLRFENASLRNDNKELDGKLADIENAKLSAELRLVRRENELEDSEAHRKAEMGVSYAQNEDLKLEKNMYKRNEEHMKVLLLSYGIQMPALFTPPEYTQDTSPLFTPKLTDDTDMDDADELEDRVIVCSQWYNHGKCSRAGGSGSEKCSQGAHPRLVDFSASLR